MTGGSGSLDPGSLWDTVELNRESRKYIHIRINRVDLGETFDHTTNFNELNKEK